MSPVAFEDWTEELRSNEERILIARAGVARAFRVLSEMGVEPPISERHADAWDPPLSRAETRHRIHDRFEMPVSGCRFCVTPDNVRHPVTPKVYDMSNNEGGTG